MNAKNAYLECVRNLDPADTALVEKTKLTAEEAARVRGCMKLSRARELYFESIVKKS